MKYWASCVKFTVLVVVDERGYIIDTAPITRRFIGQPFTNLKRWMIGLYGARFEEIE